MSVNTNYTLTFVRIESFSWESGCINKTPSPYLSVKLGNERSTARTLRENSSVTLQKPTLMPLSQETLDLIIKLKYKSIMLRNTCIAMTTVKVEELLRSSEEIKLELRPPTGQPRVVAVVVLLFKSVGVMTAANTELKVAEVTLCDQMGIFEPVRNLHEKARVVKNLVDNVAQIHPWMNASWKVITILYEAVGHHFKTYDGIVKLVTSMSEVFELINEHGPSQDKIESEPSQKKIVEFLRQCTECCIFIQGYVRSNTIAQALDLDNRSQKVASFQNRFTDLKQALFMERLLNTEFITARIDERVADTYLHIKLNPSEMDISNRTKCFPGTRVKTLGKIMKWLVSESSQNVFWLCGPPGSGKTTLSMTIQEMCLSIDRLAAYLYFRRGHGNANSIVRTMAYRLATFDPNIRKHMVKAVQLNGGVSSAPLETQFEKLLSGPLRAASPYLNGPVIIILDAIDECDVPTSDIRRTLLGLISKEFTSLPSALRFIITSRAEQDLREAFRQSEGIEKFELKVSSKESRDDISRYISHEMKSIVSKTQIPKDWPWEENMELLSRMADGLFVFASTLVKYVQSQQDFPFRALDSVIQQCQSKTTEESTSWQPAHVLANLYDSVLQNCGINWGNGYSTKQFSNIIGFILFSPLPTSIAVMDSILGHKPTESSRHIIERLQSVLDYSPDAPDAPIRPFHRSFVDYLTSLQCAKDNREWYINEASQKKLLADRLRRIATNLGQNPSDRVHQELNDGGGVARTEDLGFEA